MLQKLPVMFNGRKVDVYIDVSKAVEVGQAMDNQGNPIIGVSFLVLDTNQQPNGRIYNVAMSVDDLANRCNNSMTRLIQ